MKNGEIMEVSTGLFIDLEEVDGFYNNERFSGIWRNIVPDHLAVLSPGTIGACSVADGCGAPRTNLKGDPMTRANELTTVPSGGPKCNTGNGNCQMMGNAVCGCPDCLMGTNDALKYPDFNVVGSTDDIADDVLGLARNSEVANTSVVRSLASAAAAVRSALQHVTRKPKSAKESSVSLQNLVIIPKSHKPQPGALAALAQRFGPLIGIRTAKGRAGLSDVDARAAVQTALGSMDMYAYIVAMYDD